MKSVCAYQNSLYLYISLNIKTVENMTNSEIALNGTVEIVKGWLVKGVSSEIALLKLERMTSKELAKKIVRIAELAISLNK